MKADGAPKSAASTGTLACMRSLTVVAHAIPGQLQLHGSPKEIVELDHPYTDYPQEHWVSSTTRLQSSTPAPTPPRGRDAVLAALRNEMPDLSGDSLATIYRLLGDRAVAQPPASFWTSNETEGSPPPKLSDSGLDRYIQFTPEDSSTVVSARILNIHRRRAPDAALILVEWTVRPSTPDSPRVRRVHLLTPREAQSLIHLTHPQKESIQTEFDDSLTLHELMARRLANESGLETLGYAATDSDEGTSAVRERSSPLSRMSSNLALAVTGNIAREFGRHALDRFLTDEERGIESGDEAGFVNIFDVMARLSPGFILKEFQAKDPTFRYVFVVTEDGQLLVSPFGPADFILESIQLRLAHGRRVYAAGELTIERDGTVKLRLKSASYYDSPSLTYAGRAVGIPSDKIEYFLKYVFTTQAGRNATLDRNFSATNFFAEEVPPNHEAPGAGRSGNLPPSEFIDMPVWEKFESKVENWDQGDQNVPLDFGPWLKANQIMTTIPRDVPLKIHLMWAHYVLQTESTMEFRALKSAFRGMSHRFHPDKARFPGAEDGFKAVNNAWETISKCVDMPSK